MKEIPKVAEGMRSEAPEELKEREIKMTDPYLGIIHQVNFNQSSRSFTLLVDVNIISPHDQTQRQPLPPSG
jgi:hypothetical protein